MAWILATVFIRFCEDNGLIDLPVIAGPGDRLAIAGERQQEFFAENRATTDRDWILQGIKALSVSKVAAGLFDEAHNPMWTVTPSHDAAKALLAFWRRRAESGEIVHDFTDPDWNTRFLGDLYQDLSEHAKKTYALLQTPEFVEEFILDYTLTPAIEEFGLTPDPPEAAPRPAQPPARHRPHLRLRPLPPRRLPPPPGTVGEEGPRRRPLGADLPRPVLGPRRRQEPFRRRDRPLPPPHRRDEGRRREATGRCSRVPDQRGGRRLAPAWPRWPRHPSSNSTSGIAHGSQTHTYVTEDIDDYSKSVDMLGIGSYHVVVGNPPYITVKDKQENENYRKAYPSCSWQVSAARSRSPSVLSARHPRRADRRGAGYVGQITANSFMKREFGKKLIEEFFQKVDLTHVIDTSGAYIPGHGTPTVILIGRRRSPRQASTIRPFSESGRDPSSQRFQPRACLAGDR